MEYAFELFIPASKKNEKEKKFSMAKLKRKLGNSKRHTLKF